MSNEHLWLDSLIDGFMALDAAGCVVHCNSAVQDMLGLDCELIIGRGLLDAAPVLAASSEAIHDAMATGEAQTLAAPLVLGERSFSLRVSPVVRGGWTLQFVDVSAQVASDRRRGEDLARLAHDMRNPLAPLRTALELLKRPTVADATKERAREIMDRQIVELVGMIDRLQAIGRGLRDAPASAPAGPFMAPALADPSALPHDRGARVLVADDSELVQQSIVALLRVEGYEVRTVSDGEAAVAVANEWKPRYVLLDLHMPRLSGVDAAKQLRASHPPGDMVIVMMSGVSLNDAWRDHAKQAGFDLCVDKTADPNEWLAQMRAAGLVIRPA
ncbi:ATP-binding response regulator [Piscinibacter terrae]|uniref:histidine kinase n=1 Tax=Piscinibacter terrae TaxID=2496871 RepID=A0A3N7HIT0_9BURK|nr:hybrid sensor histidine kinase/response regulator [Albitalea terrae]RQP21947.1 hybrid sensor histidine kinase/response regulator [Albitalea terrae]